MSEDTIHAEAQRAIAPATHTVAVGDALPNLTLRLWRGGEWIVENSRELFSDRRVIVFGLPGAFTPTCSSEHLPRFEELAPALLSRGVDEIVCASVNDPYVLEAWARDQATENVTYLSDGNGEFARALGLLVDKSDLGFGRRSRRYSLFAVDGRVELCFIEPDVDGDPYTKSDADTMLTAIDPNATAPDQIVLFTREGCRHCTRARELLEDSGLAYVEIPLGSDVRQRVLGALGRTASTPLVFRNGEMIGGADELEKLMNGGAMSPQSRPA